MTEPWQRIQILTEADWQQTRSGKITASEFHKAVATIKSGWGASRRQYAGNLIVERMGGNSGNGYTNTAMQWGIDTEPQALVAYQKETGAVLTRAPEGHRLWVPYPDLAESAGATPDALVDTEDDEGIVEIKCPYISGIHLEYYDQGIGKSAYRTQVLFQLLCMPDRKWADLVSYDPRIRYEHMQMVRQRIYRDKVTDELNAMNRQVTAFVHEVDEQMNRYINGSKR